MSKWLKNLVPPTRIERATNGLGIGKREIAQVLETWAISSLYAVMVRLSEVGESVSICRASYRSSCQTNTRLTPSSFQGGLWMLLPKLMGAQGGNLLAEVGLRVGVAGL